MPLRFARRLSLGFGLLLASLVASRAHAAEGACAAAYEQTQLLRQSGKLVQARDAARACARATCPEVARKDCTTWGEQLESEVPSVIVIARDDVTGDEGGVRVQVDGVLRPEAVSGHAFEIDPGAHVFHVERAGDEPLEQTITVVRGERDRALRFVLRSTAPRTPVAAPPSAVPTHTPPLLAHETRHASFVPAVIVGSLSIASFGVSAWLGLTGRSELSGLHTSCAPTCTDAQVDPVRRRLLVSDITLGAGVAGSAFTIYLFAHALTRVDVAPTSQGAALVVRGVF